MRQAVERAAMLVFLFLGLSSFRPPPAAAALIGYWSFDGCSTTDASGNGASLTAAGSPVCTVGRFGNAWLLNGAGQYLERGADAAFTPGTRAWSVAAWVKTSLSDTLQMAVDWYRCGANPSCGTGDGALYILGVDHGHPFWEVRGDPGVDLTVNDSTLNLADGAWHFLVGTMNPATDSTKFYVDGTFYRALHGTIGSLTSGGVSIPLEVGRHFRTGWALPDFYFSGAIDEVRIYDNELTPASVASLYANNATTAVSKDGAPAFSIDGGWPNPTRGGHLVVAFTLPAAVPAQLALFDIGGRLVTGLPVGSLGAGRHEVQLEGGRGLASGVYMVRLTQGGRSCTRRVTMLK